MLNFILRALAAAAGLWVAAKIVPGISYSTVGSLIIAAVLLGLVNAVIKPIVVILTLPFTIVTLGLFLLVVNGLMLMLTAALIDGFGVQGLVAAILGSVVVSIVSWVVSLAIDRR
jgi:putative membrane protein